MSQNDDNTQDRFEDEVNEIIKNVSDDMPEFKAKPSRTLQDLLDEQEEIKDEIDEVSEDENLADKE